LRRERELGRVVDRGPRVGPRRPRRRARFALRLVGEGQLRDGEEHELAAFERRAFACIVQVELPSAIRVAPEPLRQRVEAIGVGGNHITNDIAVGLRTPSAEGEAVKQRWGCAKSAMIDPEEEIEVPSVGGRPARRLSRRVLCEIIEPRVEEMFLLVRRELAKAGYEDLLASGAVLTGGATIMTGMPELAEEVLGFPVRRGAPHKVGGLLDVVRSPKFATSVGLVQYGARRAAAQLFRPRTERVRIGGRVRVWLARVF
jgi:hypothetical protein